jgi:uncharacterized repeat protein (TIGR01451 family)
MVTKVCPAQPVAPGQLVTFSGSVSNTGNVTLTNIVVLNNQPVTNTLVFTLASLAPGAVTNFTGSYVAPTNCSVADTLTGTGRSICGVAVTNTASAACPILTAPAIEVTQTCPTTPVGQGGILTYSGTVRNAGNITLTNIVVVNNWPYSNVIFTVASLAPGATTNFTGSYVVPGNCCQTWIWVVASGQGCAGVTVSDTDSGTCTVLTSPQIVVTKVCDPRLSLLRPGDLLTYSGTVSNAGNITLINVTVVDNQPVPGSLLLTINFLAPGESQTYTGSYTVPPDFCGEDTVTANGFDACSYALVSNSATATCPIAHSPRIAITKNCPPLPTQHGGQVIYSGTVSNAGNVTLINVFVVDNQPSNNTPVIGPITLSPGAVFNFSGHYTAPPVCCETTDTVTARGQDRCSGSNVTATATTICPMLYTPGIALLQNCPPNPLPMGSVYVFSGFVTNTGDAILTNVVVFGSQAGTNLTLLGPLDLAPGQSEQYTGSLTVPSNTCAVTITVTGQETCKGTWITNTTSCPILTTPQITVTLTCPDAPVVPGGSVTYSGTVWNTGNVTLNNVFVVNNQSVPNTSVIDPLTITVTNGMVTVSWTATPGVTYSLQYKSNLLDSVWKDIAGYVTASGGTASKEDFLGLGPQRFYRARIVSDSPVIGPLTLAPGASATFTASFTAPINSCSVSGTVTVTGSDNCTQAMVTNTASATCPLITTPGIKVTKVCSERQVSPGQLLTFSGSVSNTGNVTLTNIVVVNNQPVANTAVFTVASLTPGAISNFTGSYLAPTNCSVADTLTATGQSICGVAVTNTVTATCPILTTPVITITESCPPGPVTNGSSVVFGGSVCNSGNITLTNIFVFSSQSSNTVVLGPITLAPGACAPFTGSYIAIGGCNPLTNLTIVPHSSVIITPTNMVTVTPTNIVVLTPTNTVTVTTNNPGTITTNNTVTVTTNAVPPTFVTIRPPLAPPTGEVVDRFAVGTNLNGLTYYGGSFGGAGDYPTLFYSIRRPDVGESILTFIKTEVAPHTLPPRTEPKDAIGIRYYDALAFAAPQITGGSSISFYYLRHVADASYFGYIIHGGAYADMFTGGTIGNNFDALTFAAPEAAGPSPGPGADKFYYLRHDLTGSSFFGFINPDAATAATAATDLFNLGKKIDYMTFSATDVGYGPDNQFYYLRSDTNGNTVFGTINALPSFTGTPAERAVDRFTLTGHFQELEFTPTDVGYGVNLFYSIRGGATFTTNTVTTYITNTVTTYNTNTVPGFITNTVAGFITNTVAGFITNTVITYTTNRVVSFTPTNTVTVIGMDICQDSVNAAANCGCVASAPPVLVTVTPNVNSDGFFSLSFPTEVGKSYTVQYKDALTDPTWTDLVPPGSVPGTGGPLTIYDSSPAALHPSRFYRIMSTP